MVSTEKGKKSKPRLFVRNTGYSKHKLKGFWGSINQSRLLKLAALSVRTKAGGTAKVSGGHIGWGHIQSSSMPHKCIVTLLDWNCKMELGEMKKGVHCSHRWVLRSSQFFLFCLICPHVPKEHPQIKSTLKIIQASVWRERLETWWAAAKLKKKKRKNHI